MPEICRFYGIVIQIYYGDHPPPHFPAKYGGHEAVVDIESLAVSSGDLPPRANGLVIEWASQHQEELHEAWHRAQCHKIPGKIAPLT